jgi:hypothetical protein
MLEEIAFKRRAMSELLCMARLKIHHGKLDEFKNLAARCVESVHTKDTGTLQYECGTPSPELIEQLKDLPFRSTSPSRQIGRM